MTFYYRAPTELMHVNDGWAQASAATADQAIELLRKKTTVHPTQLQIAIMGRWHFADRVIREQGGLMG